MLAYALAIDFGTNVTLAAVRAGSTAVQRVRCGADDRTPSAVMLGDDGQLHAGPHVVQEAALSPERVEWTPKRSVGQDVVVLGGRPFRDVDLVASVLGYVAQEARRMFDGRDPEAVRLTHPAVWGDSRLGALQDAAFLAGLARVELVPEPIAAATALARDGQLDGVPIGSLIAIYDLGGGTFDTALLRRTGPITFEIAGQPGGDERLGGENLDDALYAHLASTYLSELERAYLKDPSGTPDPTGWRRARYELRTEARLAKERIAGATAKIKVHALLGCDFFELTRSELDRLSSNLVRRTADLLGDMLRRNGRRTEELHAICLAGGSSRLTSVKRTLGRRFDRPIATLGDPKALTAEGALDVQQAEDPLWELRQTLVEAWSRVRRGELALPASLAADLERMARWGALPERLGASSADPSLLRRAARDGNRRWAAMEIDAPPRRAKIAEAMRRAYTLAFAQVAGAEPHQLTESQR